MAKAVYSSVLKALLGKKILFNGKFEFGERERLTAMAEAQQGLIAEELDGSIDIVVLQDLSVGKTLQKKLLALKSKGAGIQVLDAAAFRAMVRPTDIEVVQLLRAGKANATTFAKAVGTNPQGGHSRGFSPGATIVATNLDGVNLSGFDLSNIAFENCSFVGATLSDVTVAHAVDCDFSKATGENVILQKIDRSRFADASFKNAQVTSHLSGSDFTRAVLEGAQFSESFWGSAVNAHPSIKGPNFAGAMLRSAVFDGICEDSPCFDGADLAGCSFTACRFKGPTFRQATLTNGILVGSDFPGGDFTRANLAGANLAEADLSNARFDGADLAKCNLRGATLKRATMSTAKHYDIRSTIAVAIGPALTELDSVITAARRVNISFCVGNSGEIGEELQISTYGGRKGAGHAHLFVPRMRFRMNMRPRGVVNISQELQQAGAVFGHCAVRYETLTVSSQKSPLGGKELRDLVMRGIAEAFGQGVPSASELAEAAKKFRESKREQDAADKERREAAKKLAEKQQLTAKKQIANKIAKEVGKVVDIATFLKALELRADKQKIDKATKMLKASKFQLFNDASETFLNGVVKSQTDPDLVYACRIESTGEYACCTQNLNICGGLRGSICKHLLVLIIGLVKAGELDPSSIDDWIAKSNDTKPELNKETMGEIFIRYKGAEAGEVDWRPTETVPEDYYTL